MFAVCYDNQKQRYKVMRLSKTQKCEFIEICSVHNTFIQAQHQKENYLGKTSVRLHDVIRKKEL